MTSPFYKRLTEALKSLGWSPATLSKKTDISHATISRWRKFDKDTIPQARTLDRVLAATGARVEYLATGEEPIFKEVVTADLESLARVWGGLTYEDRASWIMEKTAEAFTIGSVDSAEFEPLPDYTAGKISESEFHWLCIKYFASKKKEEIEDLLNL